MAWTLASQLIQRWWQWREIDVFLLFWRLNPLGAVGCAAGDGDGRGMVKDDLRSLVSAFG